MNSTIEQLKERLNTLVPVGYFTTFSLDVNVAITAYNESQAPANELVIARGCYFVKDGTFDIDNMYLYQKKASINTLPVLSHELSNINYGSEFRPITENFVFIAK